jgi:hypothetical protein
VAGLDHSDFDRWSAAARRPVPRRLTDEVRAAAGPDHGEKATIGPVPTGPEG